MEGAPSPVNRSIDDIEALVSQIKSGQFDDKELERLAGDQSSSISIGAKEALAKLIKEGGLSEARLEELAKSESGTISMEAQDALERMRSAQ